MADAPPESMQRCSLLELRNGTCRWPVGDQACGDLAFCGNEAAAGLSYCAGHARMAYRIPGTAAGLKPSCPRTRTGDGGRISKKE